jgi:hypothetical protein
MKLQVDREKVGVLIQKQVEIVAVVVVVVVKKIQVAVMLLLVEVIHHQVLSLVVAELVEILFSQLQLSNHKNSKPLHIPLVNLLQELKILCILVLSIMKKMLFLSNY